MVQVIERLKAIEPDPKCELYYKTEFQLLVSVVLSAQATDKSVNKVMQPIYESGFDAHTVIQLGQEGFLSKIRSIGLAPTKAKNVFGLSQLILQNHEGEVPKSREELEALPGVGRKTASVVLGEIFKWPTLAVDTHVYRVTMRLGLHRQKDPNKCEQDLLALVPKSYLPAAHHWFILLGRYTCKAARPNCPECPVKDICPSQR